MTFSLRRNAVVAIFIAVLLILLASFVSYKAFAQNAQDRVSIGISPQLLDVTANPGETQTTTFRLTNASADQIAIKTTPKNFLPRGEEGSIDLTEDKTSYSLADWITVEPESANIEGSKSQDFTVTINVPNNAEPGSHFGSVVFQTIPPESDTASALVSQEIAPVILVKVAGDISESIDIEEFKAEKNFYSNQSSISLLSRLKNTGSVHFKPAGQIVIKNMFGKEAAKVDLDKKNVLPDSIRQITTDWPVDGFKVGRYTAELTVVYGDDDQIKTASTSFVIFPYQIILPAIVALVVVGYLIYRGRRRLVKAAKALSGKETGKE